MNILIIEDDQLLRKALGYHLLEQGHTLTIAANGQEALDLVKKNQAIDAIVVDVMMPVLSGPSFILSLKKIFPSGLPTIIIITNVKEGEDFLKKIEIPYDYYLAKPLDFDKLSEILGKVKGAKKG